jgi:hypothetical protein
MLIREAPCLPSLRPSTPSAAHSATNLSYISSRRFLTCLSSSLEAASLTQSTLQRRGNGR